MPTLSLPPDTHTKVRLQLRRPRVHLYVEAEEPVTTYVFDDLALSAFYDTEGNPRSLSQGGFTRQRIREQQLWLPHSGPWYVVIMNTSDQHVGVHYTLDYR